MVAVMVVTANLPSNPEEAGKWPATLTDTDEVKLRRAAS